MTFRRKWCRTLETNNSKKEYLIHNKFKRQTFCIMAALLIGLAAICIILYFTFHQKADEYDRKSSFSSPRIPSAAPKVAEHPQKPMSYWETYKTRNPQKASAIENLDIDFSSLSDKDVKEKIMSIEGFYERTGRSLVELKEEVSKRAEEAFYNMQLDSFVGGLDSAQTEDARRMNISPSNSVIGLCKLWISQVLNKIGRDLEQKDNFDILCKKTSIKEIYTKYSHEQRLGFLTAIMVIYDFTNKDYSATKSVIYTGLTMGISKDETITLLNQKHSYFDIANQLRDVKEDPFVVEDIISTCIILAKTSKNSSAITTIVLMFFNAGYDEQEISKRVGRLL